MILAVESVLQILTTPSTPLHAILDPRPEKRVFATAAVWLQRASCATSSNLCGGGVASISAPAVAPGGTSVGVYTN